MYIRRFFSTLNVGLLLERKQGALGFKLKMTNFLPAFHILIVFFTNLISSAIAISDQNEDAQTHPDVIADFYTHEYAPNCTDSLESSTNYSSTLNGLERLECLAMCSREPLCARAVYEESGLSCLLEDGAGICPHGHQIWFEKISDDHEVEFKYGY